MSHRIVLAVLLLAATAACTATPSDTQYKSANLRGKVYVSTSVQEQGKPRTLVEGTNVELRFTEDDRLIAGAGCNQMQGAVILDGGKVSVGELGMTAMGCPQPELHEQETWLAKLLEAKPEWRLDGTNLVLTGANAEIVLAAEQPATLDGTWTVDGIVAMDSISSVPAGAKVTITFKDGTVAVDSGCNRNGNAVPYELSGQTIKATLGPQTLKSCGAVDEVETAVNKAFESGAVTYKINRSTLVLDNALGAGVTLKK
ncbi:META domain-containing protein [Lentzea sp. NBRC 102530]|uniref:META domain-containing protein n=1 Tax=Lentzea sp. NBRC 102530 TaxID=3032201 RepID=UPI002553D6D5|nr:META domain-containing protein [Lentzea sp. NBRC 102530]